MSQDGSTPCESTHDTHLLFTFYASCTILRFSADNPINITSTTEASRSLRYSEESQRYHDVESIFSQWLDVYTQTVEN